MSDEGSSETQSRSESERTRLTAFRVAILITIVVLALISPVILLGLGWFLEEYQESGGGAAVSHRVHEISFGILFALALVGAVSQRRRPERNIAGMQQLVIVTVTFTVVVSLTTRFEWLSLVYVVPALVALYFHPARSAVLKPLARPWRWGVALTAVALFPFVEYAVGQMERASDGAQNHTTHWGTMAAFFLAMLLLSLLASLRPPGYRLTAISVGGAATLYGLASLVYPFDASAHGSAAGVITIIWGVLWVIVGVRGVDASTVVSPTKPRRRPKGSRRLARAAGWAVLVVGVLFVSVGWVSGDDPPHVPHALVDSEGVAVSFGDANRSTCIGCHTSTGLVGAPDPLHGLSRTCPDYGASECWAGRRDCLGCHQYNPRLGGSTEKISRGTASTIGMPTAAISPLEEEDLQTILATLGTGSP